MIAHWIPVEGRTGRAFVRDDARVARRSLGARLRREYFADRDERRRAEALAALTASGTVVAATHRGIDFPDTLYVYLRDPRDPASEPTFACMLVPHGRLEEMLRATPVVFEGFGFQVVEGPALTDAAIRSALEVWHARNYPGQATPSFVLDPWTGGLTPSQPGVRELLLADETAEVRSRRPEGAGLDSAPPTLEPRPDVAHPQAA